MKKSLLAAVVAIASTIYAPLGWCPPPPNFGVFLPSGQLIPLGAVPVDTSKSVAITFLLSPSSAASGPYAISATFPAYLAFGTPFYSIDRAATTCVPGAVVTTSTGCTVVIAFTPTQSTGDAGLTENLVISAAPVSNPTQVSSVAFDTLAALAVTAEAVPIPIASPLVLLWLSLFVVASVAKLMPRYAH